MLAISAHNNGSNSLKVLIMLRRAVLVSTLLVSVSKIAAAQEPQPASSQKPPTAPNVIVLKPEAPPANQPQFKPELRAVDLENRPKLSEDTRMKLIGLLDAEFVHVRKYLPLGAKDIVVTPEGLVKPSDTQLFQMMQASGAAAKLGDRVQITNVIFHDKSIVFEINGGAKKKSKWYQHVQIMGAGGATSTQDTPAQPTGASMTLQFNKHVPEMNADELKKLISPVLDFSVKTAAQVYAETLPPKIREAIKKHEVLVGMNKDMVIAAKDRPRHKIREKDEHGKEYEEWLYGAAPQDVTFVRFYGDEVKMVKIAKISGEVVTKTEKEVDVKDGVVSMASLKASNSPQDVQRNPEEQKQPTKRPTLKRPDEVDESTQPAQGKRPDDPSRDDDPQWGSKTPGDETPSQQPQKPPL